jgi:hypothetical protein
MHNIAHPLLPLKKIKSKDVKIAGYQLSTKAYLCSLPDIKLRSHATSPLTNQLPPLAIEALPSKSLTHKGNDRLIPPH